MTVKEQTRPLYPCGPRRSLDHGLGLAVPRRPWEPQTMPQVPFTGPPLIRSSNTKWTALPSCWSAQAHRNLAVHSSADQSARTPISSTTQTLSTARTPVSSSAPTWSTTCIPLSTTKIESATAWSSYWSPSKSKLDPSHPPVPKTNSNPWPTDKRSVVTVPETPRLPWTPFYSTNGLPSEPKSARVPQFYAKVTSPSAPGDRLIETSHVARDSPRSIPTDPLPFSMSAREAPNVQESTSGEPGRRTLKDRIKSFFRALFRQKHNDAHHDVLYIQDRHWTDDS
nr:hypothetical protein CFP56_31628 [Quercus suber]